MIGHAACHEGRTHERRATGSPGSCRLTLLGVGAMASPRYAPAGLLVECGTVRVMLDGGPGAAPTGRLDAWLLTDPRGADR
jgi:hypothetical protein